MTKTLLSELSISELIAIYLSRHLENHSFGYAGTGSLIGVAACLLAQDLHAPDLTWIAGESGFINPSPPLVKSLSGFSPRTEATKSMNAILRYLGRGVDFFIAEAGQIDGKARINRQTNPDGTCAPGNGSTAFLQSARRVLLFTTKHSKDILVDNVKFVSAWGKLHSTIDYTILITPQGVFSWKAEKKDSNLLTPELIGIFEHSKPVSEIQKITGFTFNVSKNIETVPYPSEEEIDSLRDVVDPLKHLED